MQVQFYAHTDTGAPTLSGTAGALTTLLDAILVGSGGIAYGTTPSSGWTIAYTGTNLRAYLQGAAPNTSGPSSQQFYLRVNDTGARAGTVDESLGAAVANESRIRGYITMTAITDSGTGQFPNVAANPYGYIIRKSSAASSSPRAWWAFANSRTFYLFIMPQDTAGEIEGYGFGDFYTYYDHDVWNCMLIACHETTENTADNNKFDKAYRMDTVGVDGFITARGPWGTGYEGGAQPASPLWSPAAPLGGHASAISLGYQTAPTPRNTIHITAVQMAQEAGNHTIIRGKLSGIYNWLHHINAVSHLQSLTGTRDLTGRTFLVFNPLSKGGVIVVENTSTWDVN